MQLYLFSIYPAAKVRTGKPLPLPLKNSMLMSHVPLVYKGVNGRCPQNITINKIDSISES